MLKQVLQLFLNWWKKVPTIMPFLNKTAIDYTARYRCSRSKFNLCNNHLDAFIVFNDGYRDMNHSNVLSLFTMESWMNNETCQGVHSHILAKYFTMVKYSGLIQCKDPILAIKGRWDNDISIESVTFIDCNYISMLSQSSGCNHMILGSSLLQTKI